jgi:hypothetical protein
MNIESHIYLFTSVIEKLPDKKDENYICILNNGWIRLCYFGHKNRFSENEYGNLAPTHWLDFSKLTSKERAEEAIKSSYEEGVKMGEWSNPDTRWKVDFIKKEIEKL